MDSGETFTGRIGIFTVPEKLTDMSSLSGSAENGFYSADRETRLCIGFLKKIGIEVLERHVGTAGFLPGLSIEQGCLFIDPESLLYPGDILHEAGHIAVVPAAERHTLNAESIKLRKDREAEEMMSIAWSFAACTFIGLEPEFVFHENGYKSGGSHIANLFREKSYIGLPMLQWVGLTADEKNAPALKIEPYPNMIKWLRD